MGFLDALVERQIKAGRAAGLFDNLAGAGKPIEDLDRPRPPGWWAMRVAKRERSLIKKQELDQVVAEAMPAIWRLSNESAVTKRVAQLNGQIDEYNLVTTWIKRERLVVDEVLAIWRRLNSPSP